jgi:4,5-DOPA dioxygenase extradiol
MQSMDRRRFLQLAAGTGVAALAWGGARALGGTDGRTMSTEQRHAPAVFISHGSPMVGIEDDAYTEALARFGGAEAPAAVVAISAHWEAGGAIRVTSAGRHDTIHDFGGFPRALYEIRYDAPGAPELAREIADRIGGAGFPVALDDARGLDHGAWVPLRRMWPGAHVPVVGVSLPDPRTPDELLRMGEALRSLRERNVMILGSGGIVHNLRVLDWRNKFAAPADWARGFDDWVAERLAGDRDLRGFLAAPNGRHAAPTTEHFDPVFVVLGASGAAERHEEIFTGFHHGTLSMRSFALRSA